MPYKSETITFNLESIACPEFEVEYRDPSMLPARERNKVVDAMAILAFAQRKDEPLKEADRWSLYAIDDFVRGSIVRWNLQYPPTWPDEGVRGTVIPLRVEGKSDWDCLEPLPAYVYDAILKEIGERLLSPPKSAA